MNGWISFFLGVRGKVLISSSLLNAKGLRKDASFVRYWGLGKY